MVCHPKPEQRRHDCLLIVDVQHDFLPGGALAVPDGDAVLDALEAAAPTAELVVASRDAHPADHCSFAEQGGIWPVHCVEGTHGAELHADIAALEPDIVVDKATEPRPRRVLRLRRHRAGRRRCARAASTGSWSAGSRPTTACAPRCSTRCARASR